MNIYIYIYIYTHIYMYVLLERDNHLLVSASESSHIHADHNFLIIHEKCIIQIDV
jgi:hypothetical protein